MNFLPIVHFDLDAFFASVEQKLNPKLQGCSVIVCGKGIVSTASYEARKYGVKSGMPVFQARTLCPNGFFIKGNFEEYQKHSEFVYQVLKNFTPNIERSNLDEGFLDFSGFEEFYPNTTIICDKIRQQIKNNVGITVSLGISYSRVLAKIACGLAKPDGLLAIPKDKKDEIVNPLPIDMLPGVGPKTKVILNKINIYKIGDIIKNRKNLQNLLGRHGNNIYFSALGIDNIWFNKKTDVKSIGRSTTFPKNTNDSGFINSVLFKLSNEVFYELLHEGYSCHRIEIVVRFPNFQNKTHGKIIGKVLTLPEFYREAKAILCDVWKGETLRLIGVSATKLEKTVNNNRLAHTVLNLRNKYGSDVFVSPCLPAGRP